MSEPRGERTRRALVDAALDLFARFGLAAVTVDAVVGAAGVAKGTFYVHFRDRDAFLCEIHREFHDRLEAKVARRGAEREAGIDRLWLGIVAYLDGCLAERACKALLFDARSESSLGEEVVRRNEKTSEAVARELRAARHPSPRPTARLVVAMTAEVAFQEMRRGGKQTGLRNALRAMLRDLGGHAE
ncbi:MAG: helix-turn-helix domain-containing protein [bacterium]